MTGKPNLTRLFAFACCAMCFMAPPTQAETLCADPPFDHPPRVAELTSLLRGAIAGLDGLESTLDTTVQSFCVTDTLVEARAYFEPDTQQIVVLDGLSRGLSLAAMVHELRHAEQNAQGFCPSLSLGMKDYAHAVFAMEADASVTGLVVATRLRDDGDDDMWRALANWPMQADISAAFDAHLRETGDLAGAAQVAFDTWFAEEQRTQAYYVASCLDYLDQTEKRHLLPSYDEVAPDFLAQLCRLPDGTTYSCALPPED